MGKNIIPNGDNKEYYIRNYQLNHAITNSIIRRNLPDRLFNIIKNILDDNESCENIYIDKEKRMTRDFKYSINNEYGEMITINITEKRTTHIPTNETTTYFDKFIAKYVEGNYITEETLAVDTPNEIVSRQKYVNDELTINEFMDTKKEKAPYTEEEKTFIRELKLSNTVSPILNAALEKNRYYSVQYHLPNNDYLRFSFGKASDTFDYIFLFISNDLREAVLTGNNKEATIKYYSHWNREKEISYEEFAYNNESIVKKLQQTITMLEELGVKINASSIKDIRGSSKKRTKSEQ